MIKIDEDTIRHIAALARLDVSPDETRSLSAEIEQVLGYVTKLDQLDVSGVEPTSYAVPVSCRQRADEHVESSLHEAIVAAAPQHDEGHFVVPKVIE